MNVHPLKSEAHNLSSNSVPEDLPSISPSSHHHLQDTHAYTHPLSQGSYPGIQTEPKTNTERFLYLGSLEKNAQQVFQSDSYTP